MTRGPMHGVASGMGVRQQLKTIEKFCGGPGADRLCYAHGTMMFRRNGRDVAALIHFPGMLQEGAVLLAERRGYRDTSRSDSWTCRIMGGSAIGKLIVTKAWASGEDILTFVVDPSTNLHLDHARRLCALRVRYPNLGGIWRWYVPWWRRSGLCIEQSLMQWELFMDDPSRPSKHAPGPAGLVYNVKRIVNGLE